MEDFIEKHKLRLTADSINSAVTTYERVMNNEIVVTQEIKKAVHRSIIELCKALMSAIEND